MARMPSGPMQAGRLQTWITIQVKVPAENDLGEEVESWQDWKRVKAEVVQTGGTEGVSGSQTTAISLYLVTIRYLPGLNATMRLLCAGGVYGITGVNDIQKRRRWHELTCIEDRTSQGGR